MQYIYVQIVELTNKCTEPSKWKPETSNIHSLLHKDPIAEQEKILTWDYGRYCT